MEELRRIAALYAIEADIRGQTADARRQARRQHSRPLVTAMHSWLNEQLGRISGRSALAQAIRYALNHWAGLILFLDDGRIELDTNTVERAMRPVGPRTQERVVCRRRQRRTALGDRRNPDPDGEVE